ncbi:MAG: riboflavin synthase [Candidatus Omnitrophota bacterium]|jgi:riboflavin synthase
MFTGIVEELGQVKKIARCGNVAVITVAAKKVIADTKIGDSIAVNGVCLTVVKIEADALSFDVMSATLSLTNLGTLKIMEKVNLERSLQVGQRLSGHFVSGHIDCVGIIRKKSHRNDTVTFEIAVSREAESFIVSKGSLAVDGISLTIASRKANCISVNIIPHTLALTTLSFKGPSAQVNIEYDMLMKKQSLRAVTANSC